MEPTLLFVHGAAGNHRVWGYQLKFFKNATAIDLPGHNGGTGKSSIDEYVEEVKKFCDGKSLQKIVMIGHSMGGAITQKFALDYPEYLKAIALVCTGAKLRVAKAIFDAIRKDYTQAIQLATEFAFSPRTPSEIRERAVKEMLKVSSEVTYSDFEACDKFNVMDRLHEIQTPTLIVCGSKDRLTPVKYSEYLKDNISDSRLEIMPEAGHMVMLERPKEFNEALENFVKGLRHC